MPASASDKLPVIGTIKAASNRHASTLMNGLGFETFKRYKALNPNATKAELIRANTVYSIMRQRGDMSKLGELINGVLPRVTFSARATVGKAQYPFLIKRAWSDPVLRKQVIKSYGADVATYMLLLKTAEMLGYKAPLNPDDPNFGKIGVPAGGATKAALAGTAAVIGIGASTYDGMTWYDFGTGDLQATIRPLARLMFSKKFDVKSIAGSRATSGPSPVLSLGHELWKGKNLSTGQKVTPREAVTSKFIPMAAQDTMDAYTGGPRKKRKGGSALGGLK